MSQLTPEIDPNEPRELPHGLRDYEPIQPRGTDWRELRRKIWAPFAAIAAFIAKFGVGILKFKFLLGLFISFGAYLWYGGIAFAIGLIGLIFVHEMGHWLEAKRERLEGIPACDRGPLARLARCAWRLRSRGGRGLEPPTGDRLPRLLHQPLQPAARCAPRRRADRHGDPPGVVGPGAHRAGRARHLPAQRDPRPDPDLRCDGALAALEDTPLRRLRGVLLGAAVAAADRGRLVLRPGRAARPRHARDARPPHLLGGRPKAPRAPRRRRSLRARGADRRRVPAGLRGRRADRPARGLALRLRSSP